MAKTFNDGTIPIAFEADVDLSGKQYFCAMPASTLDRVKLATGASNPVPIGVIQDDNACNVGEVTAIKTGGFTKARVSACNYIDSVACDIDFGNFLQCGPDGILYYATCGLYNARAFGFLASGSAIMNVKWLTSGCAYNAS